MATKSVNKPKTLEVIQGELYVFGNKLPRHPEFPWLFSATALHKFCEKAIRNDAKRNQVDDEKYYNAKRPAQWIRYNVLGENNTEQVAYWSKYTRRRIKKYGPNLGFASNLQRKSDVSRLTSQLSSLTDLETICITAKGNSAAILQGTYICQHVVVEYVGTFSPKFKAAVSDIFLSVLNGEVEDVVEKSVENAKKAKGTRELENCKDSSTRLIRACAEKGIRNTLKVQQGINEGILGMPGEKYRKANGLPKPLNDNLTVQQVNGKMYANLYAADEISADERPVIPPSEAKPIGVRAGIFAKLMGEDVAFKKAIAERVAAEEKLHNARMEKYKSKVKVRRSVERKAS